MGWVLVKLTHSINKFHPVIVKHYKSDYQDNLQVLKKIILPVSEQTQTWISIFNGERGKWRTISRSPSLPSHSVPPLGVSEIPNLSENACHRVYKGGVDCSPVTLGNTEARTNVRSFVETEHTLHGKCWITDFFHIFANPFFSALVLLT